MKLHRIFRISLILPLAFIMILPAGTAVQAQLSPDEVADIQQVGQVQLHPRSTHVAYTLRVPREAGEAVGRDYQELYVRDLVTGEERGIVTAPKSASSPYWIPGSDELAFTMVDGEEHDQNQVYAYDVVEEEIRRITSAPEGVMAYRFSDDGLHLVYTMREPLPDAVMERRQQGYDMEVSGENEQHVRLWLHDDREPRPVTPDDMTVWDFAWAPDSDHLAVRITHGTGIDDEMMFSEILLLDIHEGSLELLTESQGKVGPMDFSPDGTRFAFLAAKAINDPLPQRIYVSDLEDYRPVDITPDGYEGTAEWLEWKDANTLRFVAVEGTRTALREIPASGGQTELIAGGGAEIFRSVSFDASGDRFAAPVHRRNHPAEVYLGTLPGPDWERQTYNNEFLEERELGRQETITWEGPDGLLIEGVITYPVGFEEGQTYPLAILPHGGPEGVSIDGWNTRPLYPAQLLASEGYVVLKPNYRGSGGRGSEFTMANHRDLGGKEFEDVIMGIDYLSYQGVVDPRRVGISGTSYGGYFSAWAGTRYSDRFAAAITFAGLSNWISFMGTTDIPHEMSITHWDLWWFENQGLTWDRSPVANLEHARTPILVAHGLADERVHPEQSIQLHQFLKLNDITTQLVMYPRQPHGLTERAHRIDFMERVVDWFDLYVK